MKTVLIQRKSEYKQSSGFQHSFSFLWFLQGVGEEGFSIRNQEGFSVVRGTQLSSLQYTVLEFLQRQPGLLTRS